MIRGVLADNNCEGHVRALLRIVDQDATLNAIWRDLALDLMTFEQLGLPRNANDRLILALCQEERLLLITDNRSQIDDHALGRAIAQTSDESAIPVVTIGNVQRFVRDSAYRLDAAIQLMDYLLDLETWYGTGRIYIP